MHNQFKVEWFKMRRFSLFYIALCGIALIGFFYGYLKLPPLSEGIYTAFTCTISDTSFLFFYSLVSAWFIGGDFSSRTVHNEIKIGYSRWSVLLVRMVVVSAMSVCFHFAYVLSTMAGVGVQIGFQADAFRMQDVFWCVTVMLQIIAAQSFIVFIAFLLRKASAAISVSVCFSFITGNILRNFMEAKIFTVSCFYFVQDASNANLAYADIFAISAFGIMTVATYLIFNRADIK